MLAILRGVQIIDFEDEKTGKRVQGLSLQLNYEVPYVMGMKSDSKFLSQALCDRLKLNASSFKPFFDHWLDIDVDFGGRIQYIEPVEVEER